MKKILTGKIEVFFFLAWKEILVRYRHAFLGLLWAFFRPLITAYLFSRLFSSHGILFVLSAYLPWQFFSTSLLEMTPSLLNNSNLINKVYFPRSFIPLSLMAVNGIDFLVVFVAALLWHPPFCVLALPFLTLQLALLTAGMGLFLSAVTVRFRDVRFLVPFFVQLSLFLSPVVYSSIDSYFYPLNPLVGLIESFRWALLGISPPSGLYGEALSISVTCAIFVCGLSLFQRQERSFADAL